ncbi:MAG: zinc metallopeptidase [Coriobacteriales bacterium]
MSYLLLVIIVLALGLGTQSYINSQYRKWSKVPISTRMTGAEAARRMLDANGLAAARIDCIAGSLTDNFDPRSQVLHLSQDVYNGTSVAATAVACHEAGHAVQHARGYTPARVRMALVPAVNFAANIWIFLLIAGIFLNLAGLVWASIILFGVAVLFQIVTLPVEFDASHRALETISASGVNAGELSGASTVLRAAALTYVASTLSSVLQLLYFVGMARD